ncbi:MAG: ABC transporter permease [Anaerolineales bacterium]|nr:MAG: ABC transporter permease [Anaerolineales bacterium]
MRGLKELTKTSIKLYIREPIATFFTLAFPTMLILIFGAMYGNDPSPIFGGLGSMDVSMPAYSALILGTIGLLSVPITTAGYREQGVLRRFRATPMRPLTYIASDLLTNLAMTILGMTLLVIVGWLLYRVQFDGNILLLLFAVILSGLAMSSMGYLIASIASGARVAQVIGMVIFYPMMFLSGAGMPIEFLPPSLQRVSDFLPLTYVARLLRGLWFGEPFADHLFEVAVLAGILIVFGAAAARYFRWE